nr:MAG TPA: hypothetical protein [Caudoviricetes sp.]
MSASCSASRMARRILVAVPAAAFARLLLCIE